jgi:hypothetical protein
MSAVTESSDPQVSIVPATSFLQYAIQVYVRFDRVHSLEYIAAECVHVQHASVLATGDAAFWLQPSLFNGSVSKTSRSM